MATTRIRDEIARSGTLGRHTYDLLIAVFKIQLRRFPGLLDLDSIEDFAHEFFATTGEPFVVAIGAAHDDDAASRLTHRWAKYWLVDRARELPLGALRNRLEKRLERSQLFERSEVTHHWKLVDADDADGDALPDDLRRIAAAAVIHLDSSRGGSTPRLGRKGELETLLVDLLSSAGRMHISQITQICADRFPALVESGDLLLHTFDVDENEGEREEYGQIDPGFGFAEGPDLDRLAESLLETLPVDTRLVLRYLDDAEKVQELMGIGRSAAYKTIMGARNRLREAAGDDELSRPLLERVVALLVDERTIVPSSSSDKGSEGLQR